jgi:hypothetical protein
MPEFSCVKGQITLNTTIMGVAVLGILTGMVAVIGIFTMIIYLRKYKNDERMAMIEKGVSADLLDPGLKTPGAISFSLRASLLMIGVGLGFLCGYFLDRNYDMDEVGYFSMLFIFGGIGLGLAYVIEERKQRR